MRISQFSLYFSQAFTDADCTVHCGPHVAVYKWADYSDLVTRWLYTAPSLLLIGTAHCQFSHHFAFAIIQLHAQTCQLANWVPTKCFTTNQWSILNFMFHLQLFQSNQVYVVLCKANTYSNFLVELSGVVISHTGLFLVLVTTKD